MNAATPPRPGVRPAGTVRAEPCVGNPHAGTPRLLVFAKEPVPGQVKTRLAAAYGVERAAAIYRDLTAVTLAHARAARAAGLVGAIELWCSPTVNSSWFAALAFDTGASLHAQSDDSNLGERMSHAIADALARGTSVLLIGTDCPWLDPEALRRAGNALASHDAVLGPAEDGGFVLVGARQSIAFGVARWSTSHACADAGAAFTRTGLHWCALPASWDVDEPADYERWDALRIAAAAAAA
jgi:rSAM/selenodomain-associated transferase 1